MSQSPDEAKRKRRSPPRRPPWDASELEPFNQLDPWLSALLWQRCRDVRLWAAASPSSRPKLFHVSNPYSSILHLLPSALVHPLGVLQKLVERPGVADRSSIGEACRQVLAWAESQKFFPVALHYADAWAYVDHRSAQAAATAGQYCTRAANYGRAEEWLIRAVALGRKAKDWEWYIRAYVRRGILRYELGDYPRARRYALRAANKAAWSGHDKLGGMAYHDLLAVAIHTGTFQQGERYAAHALDLYPIKFDRARHLAHDYALFLARRSCYSVAMPLLRAIEPLFGPGDPMRILWLATTAEVAAALKDGALFDRLSAEVLHLVEQSEEQAAIALLRVAGGFRRFGLWTEAEVLAVRSLEIALRRSEGEPQRGAYRLLDEISERKPASPDQPPPTHARVADLIATFFTRLAKQYRLGILPHEVVAPTVPPVRSSRPDKGQPPVLRSP